MIDFTKGRHFFFTGNALQAGGLMLLGLLLQNINEAKGGVIVVDEAYQLDDKEGQKVLDFIGSNSERLQTKYGPLVWVFTGEQSTC